MKKTVSIERILFTTIFTAIAVGSTDIKKCLFYENTQCTGDVLTNTTTSSVGQCIAECARNKNCYGLTFHDTILESNCVLCGSSMSLQKKLTTPEVSSAVCRGSEIENVKGCIKLKTGKLIGRYTDIYIDKNSCTQACMAQSSCFAFTWTAKNNSQKNCFLYKDGYRLDVSANETSETYICKDTNHCHVNLHSCDRNAKCIDLIGGNMTVSHACVCDTDYIGDGSVCRKCIFKDGDGLSKFGGISEHNIGLTATAADCVASCYRLRSVDSFINGATYPKSGVNKNCFCELGMVKRNVDGHWKSCIMEDLPIDGGWSDWSAWSQILPCFPTCGSSLKTMSRNRSCNNPTPVRNGKPCEGKFNETTFETCEEVKCPPVPYNQRYEYHISTDTLNWWDANTKCKSKPKRFLARFKTPEDFKQIQVKIDNKPYWVGMVDPLNDVNKLRWENSKTYIKGYKGEWHVNEPDQTDEKCVMIGKPNKKLSDMECSNTTHIRYICMTDLRVNGNWSQWSNWTIASTCTPCGKFGTQILERKRRCDNPLPAHTGLECKGNSSEMKTVACMPQPCSTSKISGDVRTEVIVISILLPIILLVPALVLLYMYMKRRKLRADYPNNRATFRAHIPPPRTDTYSDHWEVIPSKIQCLEKIGYGAFGNVYSANLDKDVIKKSMFNNKASPHKKKEIFAVKFLKDNANDSEQADFHAEIELMKTIGYHKNVISMIGCTTLKEPRCLIIEYMPCGDLLTFLRRSRSELHSPINRKNSNRYVNTPTDHKDILLSYSHPSSIASDNSQLIVAPVQGASKSGLSQADLLSFSWQIASGMEYLTSKKLVHRDLAARNILVDFDKQLKISDFGLTRFLNSELNYQGKTSRKLPIRWMSIEAIFDYEFTTYSDVWAYGIVLFEITTLGGTPYPGITVKELLHLLKTGYRLEKPDNCSDNLYKIMKSCWGNIPQSRPTFTELREDLEEMLEQDESYVTFDIDEQHEYYLVPSFLSVESETDHEEEEEKKVENESIDQNG